MSTSVETAAGRLIVPCPPAWLSGPVAHRAPPYCHTTIPSRPRCRPFLILIATEPAIIAHCAQNVSFATNNEKAPGRTKRSGKAGRGAGNALRPPHYGPFLPIFPILSNLDRTVQDWKGLERMVALGAQRTAPICGARRRTRGRRRGRCERRWSRRGRGRHCARWRGRGPCRRRRACGPR